MNTFISSERLDEFHEIVGTNVTYDDIKSDLQSFSLSSDPIFFELRRGFFKWNFNINFAELAIFHSI